MEHLRGDDGPERLADEHEPGPAVVLEDREDLSAQLGAPQSRVREAEADFHDLKRDEADGAAGGVVEFAHQAHVGVQTDADAVDQDHGDTGSGGVRAMVV